MTTFRARLPSFAQLFARLFRSTKAHVRPSYGYAPASVAELAEWNETHVSRQQRRRLNHKATKRLIRTIARQQRMYTKTAITQNVPQA